MLSPIYSQFTLPFGGEARIQMVSIQDMLSQQNWKEETFGFTPQFSDVIWVSDSGMVMEKFNHIGHGILYDSWDEFKMLQENNIKFLRNFEEGSFHGVFFQLNSQNTPKILESVSYKEQPSSKEKSHRTILLEDGRVLLLSKGSGWGELFENIEGYNYYLKNYLQGGGFIVPIPSPAQE